jgi:hypothetical protein
MGKNPSRRLSRLMMEPATCGVGDQRTIWPWPVTLTRRPLAFLQATFAWFKRKPLP